MIKKIYVLKISCQRDIYGIQISTAGIWTYVCNVSLMYTNSLTPPRILQSNRLKPSINS